MISCSSPLPPLLFVTTPLCLVYVGLFSHVYLGRTLRSELALLPHSYTDLGNMHSSAIFLVFLPALVSAINLWVSSYAGTVTTLSLTENTTAATYSLATTYTSNDCLNSPSWLLFNSTTRILYCVGEGLTSPAGTLSTFKAQANGQLTETNQVATIVGGVHAVQYSTANGTQYLAIAH